MAKQPLWTIDFEQADDAGPALHHAMDGSGPMPALPLVGEEVRGEWIPVQPGEVFGKAEVVWRRFRYDEDEKRKGQERIDVTIGLRLPQPRRRKTSVRKRS